MCCHPTSIYGGIMKKLFFIGFVLAVMCLCVYLIRRGHEWAAIPFIPCLAFIGSLNDF